MTAHRSDLAERYGAPAPWQRRLPVVLAGLVGLVAIVWLGWATLDHASPDVRSEMVTYEVVSDHEARARVDVELADGVEATCRVRAVATDGTPVGEKAFTPVAGTNEVVITTERRADRVEKLGCTAPGQDRPR